MEEAKRWAFWTSLLVQSALVFTPSIIHYLSELGFEKTIFLNVKIANVLFGILVAFAMRNLIPQNPRTWYIVGIWASFFGGTCYGLKGQHESFLFVAEAAYGYSYVSSMVAFQCYFNLLAKEKCPSEADKAYLDLFRHGEKARFQGMAIFAGIGFAITLMEFEPWIVGWLISAILAIVSLWLPKVKETKTVRVKIQFMPLYEATGKYLPIFLLSAGLALFSVTGTLRQVVLQEKGVGPELLAGMAFVIYLLCWYLHSKKIPAMPAPFALYLMCVLTLLSARAPEALWALLFFASCGCWSQF